MADSFAPPPRPPPVLESSPDPLCGGSNSASSPDEDGAEVQAERGAFVCPDTSERAAPEQKAQTEHSAFDNPDASERAAPEQEAQAERGAFDSPGARGRVAPAQEAEHSAFDGPDAGERAAPEQEAQVERGAFDGPAARGRAAPAQEAEHSAFDGPDASERAAPEQEEETCPGARAAHGEREIRRSGASVQLGHPALLRQDSAVDSEVGGRHGSESTVGSQVGPPQRPRRVSTGTIGPEFGSTSSLEAFLLADEPDPCADSALPQLADFLSAAGEGDGSPDGKLVNLRKRFGAFDTDASGCIEVGELAKCWASAVEAQSGQPLTPEEQGLIAADVQRFFEHVDVDRNGRVSFCEWLHYALLEAHSPGPAALKAIGTRLRELASQQGLVSKIVCQWQKADADCTGRRSRAELAAAWKACGYDRDAARLTSHGDDEQSVSYAEFCAEKLGLDFATVELLYYDLSKSFAKYLAPLLLWRAEEGLWHTGLLVFGKEYYYFGYINANFPGQTEFGMPTKSLNLGATLWSQHDFERHIDLVLASKYTPFTYDTLGNNCNHCCDDMALFLLGRHIPNEVRFLPNRLLSGPLMRKLIPMLNQWLGGAKDAVDPKKPSLRRGVVREDVSSELLKGGGGVVLYEAPGLPEPAVAQVIRTHKDGTSDVAWFDGTGRRQVTQHVDHVLLRPYRLDAREREGAQQNECYMEALESLASFIGSSEGQEGSAAQFEPAWSVGESHAGSLSVTHCPQGHQLRPGARRFWEGVVHGYICGRCRRRIDRGEKDMSCNECKYRVCQTCWEASRCAPPEDSRSARTCPSGHLLEKVAGQALREKARCITCGRTELGATSPFFYSCQLCNIDVCLRCAEGGGAPRPRLNSARSPPRAVRRHNAPT